MTIMDTVNKLGHYAKKAAKVVLTPVNTAIAIVAIASTMSIGEVQAQTGEGQDAYADGVILTKDAETGFSVPDVDITLIPYQVAMVNPDTIYTFISNAGGVIEYDSVIVYNDSTTGLEEYFKTNTTIFPNPGSEINVDLPSKEIGFFTYYNAEGKLVGGTKFNSDKIYMDVSKEAAGPLFYRITLEDGVVVSGTYIKQNVSPRGPATKADTQGFNKNTIAFYEAQYWMKWEKEGYYTDSTLVTLVDGTNSPLFAYLASTTIPVPQYQYITGIAKDDENGNTPLENITAILYNQTLNETTTVTTGPDGKYVFEEVPAGSVCFLSVGDLDGYYHWNDIEYTTPAVMQTMSDTLMNEASAVMYAVDPDIQSFNALGQMTENGTQNGERKYWFGPDVPPSDETEYVAKYAQYDTQIGGHTHVQTADSLEADIRIYDGNYSTTTQTTTVPTPFGDLHPSTTATMYLNPTQGYGAISHEYGQGDGMSQGGSGYLSSNPAPTGPTAEDIAVDVIDYTHWVENVYGTNNETWFDLNKLSDEFNNKSPQFKASQSNSFGTNVEVNYSQPESKEDKAMKQLVEISPENILFPRLYFK